MYTILSLISDNENPKIVNTPSNVTQHTDNGLPTAVVTWTEPTATDNSGSVTLTSSHDSGSTFNIGVTIVTYSAIDETSNMVTETFTVTIEGVF